MLSKGFNHPTEFEIVTAIAFVYYMEENVDFLVLEVGLGGRFDSTNVIENSLASVITTISMDHTDILGDTIGKIAYEKAGIIKENGLVISYPQEKEAQDVILEVAEEKKAQLTFAPIDKVEVKEMNEFGSRFDFRYKEEILRDIKVSLLGEHQIYNASMALTTILELRNRGLIHIEEEAIRKGLEAARWGGRLEVLKRNPTFLIDGAHNIQGIHSLIKAITELFSYKRIILGIGILADKDVENMISQLVPIADKVIATEPNIFRALKAEELGKIVEKYNNNYVIESGIEDAINRAYSIAEEDDLIVFAGSLYLIGDVRSNIKNK